MNIFKSNYAQFSEDLVENKSIGMNVFLSNFL